MNLLVLGSGGREHAIAKQLAKSSRCKKIFVAPGNGGTAEEFTNADIELKAPWDKLCEFIESHRIDLTVVGPEDYLINGAVDTVARKGHKIFGPGSKAAMLEGSKQFAKELMTEAGIPTAAYQSFNEYEAARRYLQTIAGPYVLKADGLAAGKGVIIARDIKQAEEALDAYFIKKQFGNAGSKIVIESFLTGKEASILAFTDGKTFQLLQPSQDHKPAFDNDQGPNTGGMGVYTPVKILPDRLIEKVLTKILYPAVNTLKKRGIVYKGILYAGLMIDKDEINVVEFNARFGDPETECVLPNLKTDLIELMEACIEGRLAEVPIELEDRASCTVILASGGYPGKYETGIPISGLTETLHSDICHAGTARRPDGTITTAGGRVLAVTAHGNTLSEAIKNCYFDVEKISFAKAFYRKDIGRKGL